MFKNKVNQNKGTINKELIQRLDKMDDVREFNPYDPIKRTTIMHDDLFDNKTYESTDDDYINTFENKKKESKLPIIIIGIVIVALVASVAYLFMGLLK